MSQIFRRRTVVETNLAMSDKPMKPRRNTTGICRRSGGAKPGRVATGPVNRPPALLRILVGWTLGTRSVAKIVRVVRCRRVASEIRSHPMTTLRHRRLRMTVTTSSSRASTWTHWQTGVKGCITALNVSDALKAGWIKTATWSPSNVTRRSCK